MSRPLRRLAAAALAGAVLALGACATPGGLRHEQASLPTRDVVPIQTSPDEGGSVSEGSRTRVLQALLASDPVAMASDKAAAQAALQRLERCGLDCLVVAPPAVLGTQRFLLATVASEDRNRPGAAFALHDAGPAPTLALVVTGYDIYLGAGGPDSLIAIAGNGPDAADPAALHQSRYRLRSDGSFAK